MRIPPSLSIILLVLLLLVSAAFAQNWQQLYDQALRDLEAARWEDAISKLREAVKQQPVSGRPVPGGQGQTLRYFPYYLLGKAHFHLGRYPEANDFFARESGQAGVPEKLVQDIESYQRQIQAVLERKQQEFNGAVEQARAARLKGAFGEAAGELERARQIDPAEFKAKGLEQTLSSVRQSEKKQAEENRFRLLVNQAAEKERQNSLAEAASILDEADRLSPGRVEVKEVRARIKKREESYTSLKAAAENDEKERRLAAAVDKLRLAAEAHPERFISDGLSGKLAQLAASISRQAEIQQELIDAGQALREGSYRQAVDRYEKVLEKDPGNPVAVEQKRRAQALYLIEQGQELIQDRAFEDALAAFSLSYDLDQDNGERIYERMKPQVQSLRRQDAELRREWLELMSEADPGRFKRENPRVSATGSRQRPRPRPTVTKPNPPAGQSEDAEQKAVLAAIQGPPEEAVRLLEKLKSTRGQTNAELESWTGVAYARQSLLTADPAQKQRLRAKASEHFKLARRMDPDHELNPSLVAPHIQQIFREAGRQGE